MIKTITIGFDLLYLQFLLIKNLRKNAQNVFKTIEPRIITFEWL